MQPRRRRSRLLCSRVLLLAATAASTALLAGCSDDAPGDQRVLPDDVVAMQERVDDLANDLVPSLLETNDASIKHAAGQYAPCPAAGHWRYFATFTLDLPQGDAGSVLATARTSMEANGLTGIVENADGRGGWTTTVDGLRVWVGGRDAGDIQGLRVESAQCVKVADEDVAAVEAEPRHDYDDLR
ncbi:outer membrane murein-binding lipoprotein Lpp [Nocardioides daedukensis]|uniref:Outer membrane murein-binding lipoprotein Lpp n=1 Tax=Nocardioides daedukensis TaxID=634462 RepID=A0A7Y9S1R1_9ACTN|nr:hypothetical protein [Nocardioides daedukensis]NYG58518.1 outer membrane murein-binding lipoprotein Lpp [Nocardioides daedukensis]